MSAEATGWVWRHSPYTGAQLLVHLAIADVVNDVHGNEFWMSTGALAKKARVSRNTVTTTLAHMVERGWLEMLESGQASRKPSRYRFSVENLGGASAVSALVEDGMTGQRASTSAVSVQPLARSARANPKEITQETKGESFPQPNSDCVRCHGSGTVYNALGGFDVPCSCATVVE